MFFCNRDGRPTHTGKVVKVLPESAVNSGGCDNSKPHTLLPCCSNVYIELISFNSWLVWWDHWCEILKRSRWLSSTSFLLMSRRQDCTAPLHTGPWNSIHLGNNQSKWTILDSVVMNFTLFYQIRKRISSTDWNSAMTERASSVSLQFFHAVTVAWWSCYLPSGETPRSKAWNRGGTLYAIFLDHLYHATSITKPGIPKP